MNWSFLRPSSNISMKYTTGIESLELQAHYKTLQAYYVTYFNSYSFRAIFSITERLTPDF